MLLAVDIGNTNIKLGVFTGGTLTAKLSIPTARDLTATDLEKLISARITQTIEAVIVSSVVPELNDPFRDFVVSAYSVTPYFVSNDVDLGLEIKYEPLSDAGSDRLVNTFAAVEKYGVPLIVCSFGTALTIDVVDAERTLSGGLIAPGMNTLAAALKLTTSRLPEVEIETPGTAIQNTTVGSIQSGIVYGYFGLVKELLDRVKRESGDNAKVVATGGSAQFVADSTGQIDVVDKDLLLDGLYRLHTRLTAT